MIKKILILILLFAPFCYSQNSADVDLVVGSGFVGLNNARAVEVQTDGKIIVGGIFTKDVNGTSVLEGRVIRYNSNGTLDSTFSTITLTDSGYLYDIALQSDGKILISGNFTTVNGEYLGSIVRLNSDGSIDASFVGSYFGLIESIGLQTDGKIILGGNGSYIVNGHSQNKMVRLNSNGTIDNTFDLGLIGFPSTGVGVYKVVVQTDGKILAVGNFSTFNNNAQGRIIRFNSNGTKDTNFNIGTGITEFIGLRNIVLQSDGKIIIAGAFSSFNGQPFGRLCRLNIDGSIDTSYSNFLNTATSPSPSVISLQSDGKLIAVGSMIINNQDQRSARINIDGSLDTTFINSFTNSSVNCMAIQSDDKIIVGGFMSSSNREILINGVGRVNANGSKDATYGINSGLNDEVITVALLANDKTLLGGNFTTFNGVVQNKLICLNNDGTKDETFLIGTGFNDAVKTLAVQIDGKIIVGGSFTEFNGQTANYLVRLNANGTIDNSFDIGVAFNNSVEAIRIQPNGKILVGGSFTSFNSIPQNYLIRLNSNGSKDNDFVLATAFNNKVSAIAFQSDGKIYVGGNFTSFNGNTQNGLIQLNSDGTKSVGFDGNTQSYFNVNDIVIQPDGKILIAWNSLRRLNTDGSTDTTFSSGLNFGVKTIALLENGKMIVGGAFNNLNGAFQNRIVKLNSNGTKDITFDNTISGTGGIFTAGFTEGSCNNIKVRADGKIWAGGSFFHYKGVSSFSIIRLVGDSYLSNEDFENNQNNISFYPNPVKDILHLSKLVDELTLFDITGKILEKKSNYSEIDFSKFSDGIYIISVENNDGLKQTFKIVKKN